MRGRHTSFVYLPVEEKRGRGLAGSSHFQAAAAAAVLRRRLDATLSFLMCNVRAFTRVAARRFYWRRTSGAVSSLVVSLLPFEPLRYGWRR